MMILICSAVVPAAVGSINLQKIYPPVSAETRSPGTAYAWEFGKNDVYRLARFSLSIPGRLDVSTESAFVGIGHCEMGAVWAVIIPDSPGTISGQAIDQPMNVANIWLRFNPGEINRLLPPKTITKTRQAPVFDQMERIARYKITSSWQSGGRACLPPPGNITLDIQNDGNDRRFFMIDTSMGTAELAPVFNNRPLSDPVPMTQKESLEQFDTLWKAFDTRYPGFGIRQDIDWSRLKRIYYPKFSVCVNSAEFADAAAELLRNLKDRHVWVNDGIMPIEVYVPQIERHFNFKAVELAVNDNKKTGSGITWGITSDQIGYIMIPAWQGNALSDDLDVVLEQMRDTRGLIVDVRANGGGSEPIARDFAGRFLAEPHTYAFSIFKNGDAHDDLTDKQPRRISVRGPWQYRRPVLLLIDEPCLSSNESFICMMKGSETVTTMGYRTGGSSGNPRFETLPCGITYSIPQWIDCLPDGSPLEMKGIMPDILCTFAAEEFRGEEDPVFTRALAHLKQVPLPEDPITGPVVPVADRPRIIDVSPDEDAVVDPGETTLRIRFDRPMNPHSGSILFRSGGCVPLGQIVYDQELNEFSVPVKFFPGNSHAVVISSAGSGGFIDENGTAPESFTWGFTVSDSPWTDRPIPKVTGVVPGEGSELGWITIFAITFDGPMDPDSVVVPVVQGPPLGGDYSIIPMIEYDPASCTFRVPVVMKKNWSGIVTFHGFRDSTGRLTESVELPVRTGEEMFLEQNPGNFLITADPGKFESLEQQILAERQAVHTFMEHVITDGAMGIGIHGYQLIIRRMTVFAVDDEKCFADSGPIRMGFDGRQWWAAFKPSRTGESAFQWTSRSNDTRWTVFSDPLYVLPGSAGHGKRDPHLEYLGLDVVKGQNLHRFRRWTIMLYPQKSIVFVSELYVDANSGLLHSQQRWSNLGLRDGSTVEYQVVNGELDPAVFDLATYTKLQPEKEFPFRDPAEAESVETYFYLIDDGSSGNTQVRFGFTDSDGNKRTSGMSDYN